MRRSKARRDSAIIFTSGPVAQLVEQRIENPRVVGSIPTQATTKIQDLAPFGVKSFSIGGVQISWKSQRAKVLASSAAALFVFLAAAA
jgi:hypothetical protein